MTRSAFFKTLATLLAGAHTAGPVSLAGLPDAVRRCLPNARVAAAACHVAPIAPAAPCR